MATSKTLTPTNVTIQIPDFTDQPDQRVNSNCIDKEADAINALNGNISSVEGGVPIRKAGAIANGNSVSLTLSNTLSANAEFAIVCLNVSGNSLAGMEILVLGKGSSKVKALIGSMPSSFYSVSYSSNVWTLTNNSGSDMYYTAIISK